MALRSSIVASAMIKSTYSLDLETVRKVELLAARWKVSKSEVLRRAVAVADKAPAVDEKKVSDLTPLEALHKLQEHMKLTAKQARDWEAEVRRERDAPAGTVNGRAVDSSRHWISDSCGQSRFSAK
jgi:ribbon-helix-helix CopG family protein